MFDGIDGFSGFDKFGFEQVYYKWTFRWILNIFLVTFMEIFSQNLINLSPKVPFRGLFSWQEHESILAEA